MPTRSELIAKAASLPVGDPERKRILTALSRSLQFPGFDVGTASWNRLVLTSYIERWGHVPHGSQRTTLSDLMADNNRWQDVVKADVQKALKMYERRLQTVLDQFNLAITSGPHIELQWRRGSARTLNVDVTFTLQRTEASEAEFEATLKRVL